MAGADLTRKQAVARLDAMEEDLFPIFRRALRAVIAELNLPTPGEAAALLEDDTTVTAALSPSELSALLAGWRREVDGRIAKGMRAAFLRVAKGTADRFDAWERFGPSIRDVRAADWYGSIRNRLVGIGDTLYREATDALRRSLEAGESPAKAAARVSRALDVAADRARTIARTEAAAVIGAADLSVATELADAGVVMSKQWLSTDDARTRASHLAVDGDTVAMRDTFTVGDAQLMYPGDPDGPPEEVINCFPGDTLVQYPSLRAATRRTYNGDVITIHMESGGTLTGTPNHPVLHSDGWAPMETLEVGHQMVRIIPHPDAQVTQIGDVYTYADTIGDQVKIAGNPGDFHGDGYWQRWVNLARVQGMFDGQPSTDDDVEAFGRLIAELAGRGGADVDMGFGAAGFSSGLMLDRVVGFYRGRFEGPVYNLDTGVGWYIANGVPSKNCRCVLLWDTE